jgi:hypothetical protein
MGTPSWLYYLVALLMLVVAADGLVLLFFSVSGRHHPGRDVDIAHIFMGISMAGMFVSKWAFGPNAMWELIFAALLIWFIVQSIQSIQRFGPHKPHQVIHATMSLAMLLMYWYPVGSISGSPAMSMSASSAASKLDPGLGFALAVIFLASAIFTLASPIKGASHHGTHSLAYAASGAAGTSRQRISSEHASPTIGLLEALVTKPSLEDASHVVMGIAMAFMLILML